jgi:hypothetical protein
MGIPLTRNRWRSFGPIRPFLLGPAELEGSLLRSGDSDRSRCRRGGECDSSRYGMVVMVVDGTCLLAQ